MTGCDGPRGQRNRIRKATPSRANLLCAQLPVQNPLPRTHFKSDVLHRIPKKAGAVDRKEFRTLALQPVAAKVYVMVLREWLSEWLQQQLLEPQYGFRLGRGCADALVCLRSLLV